MSELKNLNYTPILYSDLLSYINDGKRLPFNPIMINFDDGYLDAYSKGFPILKKYNIKASFGIITGFADKSAYMNWDQIKEMKANGQEFVSHTVDHPDLRKTSDQNLESELKNSKAKLDEELSQNTKVIIYPSGKYDERVAAESRKIGYTLGRTTILGDIITDKNFMSLNVIRITNKTSIEALKKESYL